MKPPSLQAGEYGTWVATTDRTLTGYPVSNSALPPCWSLFNIEYT